MSGRNKPGFTDEAAQQDLFEIKKYIEGLTSFIENCNTPMTISVQGSWGTGKSSIMTIIRNSLAENCSTQTVWFNTWQFSQFNMDNDLAFSLLSCLLNELSLSDESREKVSRTTRAIQMAQTAGKLGQELLLSLIDARVGGRFSDNAEKAISFMLGAKSDNGDPAMAIKDLRDQFTECVRETLRRTGKDRIVVFIDDLDRLEPRRAVELLEVLKLFLDCESCVFVLAIDYDVVVRGVKAKYGGDMGDDKGRSFFDKIIQVPFKMPVAEYNIKNYVIDCFERIGIPCKTSEADTYVELIKRSAGTNPRSMKRLFNAYLLLTMIVSKEILESDRNKQLLFAVLCLQHSYEKVYNYIVSNRDNLSMADLVSLKSGSDEIANDQLEDLKLTKKEAAEIKPFMEMFVKVIDINEDGAIQPGELKNLANVLGVSTITTSSDEPVEKRQRHVEIVPDAAGLGIAGKDPAELEALVRKIRAVGDDITYTYRKTSNSHILFKTRGNKTFADIFMRTVGVSVDCVGATKAVFTPDLMDIIDKYGVSLLVYSEPRYYVSFPVTDRRSEEDFMKIIKACYDSFH